MTRGLRAPGSPRTLVFAVFVLVSSFAKHAAQGTGCPFPSAMGRGRCQARSNPRVPSGRTGGRREAAATAPAVVGRRGRKPPR